jgi:cell division protease FtsH
MTFVPRASPRVAASSAVRSVMFWALMVLLAVVFWWMTNVGKAGKEELPIDYSAFMHEVDLNNIAGVSLRTSQSTTEIKGEFRQPSQKFKVTIPKEVIPSLMDQLRHQGIPIEVKTSGNASWLDFMVNLAPFLLLLGLWIFILKRKLTKSDQSEPNDLSNRPIG